VQLTTQEVAAGDVKVQVCLFAFDLLYINGRVRETRQLQAILTRN